MKGFWQSMAEQQRKLLYSYVCDATMALQALKEQLVRREDKVGVRAVDRAIDAIERATKHYPDAAEIEDLESWG